MEPGEYHSQSWKGIRREWDAERSGVAGNAPKRGRQPRLRLRASSWEWRNKDKSNAETEEAAGCQEGKLPGQITDLPEAIQEEWQLGSN